MHYLHSVCVVSDRSRNKHLNLSMSVQLVSYILGTYQTNLYRLTHTYIIKKKLKKENRTRLMSWYIPCHRKPAWSQQITTAKWLQVRETRRKIRYLSKQIKWKKNKQERTKKKEKKHRGHQTFPPLDDREG